MQVWIVWYTNETGRRNIWMVCGSKERAQEEERVANEMGFRACVVKEEVIY